MDFVLPAFSQMLQRCFDCTNCIHFIFSFLLINLSVHPDNYIYNRNIFMKNIMYINTAYQNILYHNSMWAECSAVG